MSIKIGRHRKQQPHVHGLFPEHRAGDRCWLSAGAPSLRQNVRLISSGLRRTNAQTQLEDIPLEVEASVSVTVGKHPKRLKMEDDISRARMDGIEMVKTISRPLSQQQNPNRVGPIRKPGLDLIENDEVKTKRPSMWNIVLYNDDYTPMDFVELVLKTVFHITTLDALALTLAVHTKGKCIAGTYTFEVAEQKQCEVLLMAKVEEHPLRVEVEPA